MSAYSAAILGSSGLIGYWRFDGSSSPMADSVGSNNFTYTSGVTTGQTGGIANDANAAISIASTRLLCTTPASLTTGNAARTTSIWFKTSTTSLTIIFTYGNQALLKLWEFAMGGTYVGIYLWDGSNEIQATVTGPANGSWHFLAATYDGARALKLYYDGAQVGSKTISADLATADAEFQIGQYAAGGYNFNGTLDEFAWWNRALSADEVLYHYNLGKGIIANDQRSRPGRRLQAVTRSAVF